MSAPASVRGSLLQPTTRHLPLLALAASMAVLAVVAAVMAGVQPRQITGVDGWFKPLKFALSVGIYSVTLAWLIGMLRGRLRRIARVGGTLAAIGLGIEMVVIVGFAAVGDTSHFNVSTPFHAAMWALMAGSIAVVWLVSLGVAVLLFRTPLGDRARTWAIRAGAVIGTVGMGLAFLMTGPTAQQLDDYQGIVGAHTVGVADGGPSIPVLGWSTVAGDLRIPHFVGMHALQLLPLAALLLELLAVALPALREPRIRRRLVIVLIAAYALTLALLTVQALLGQSIVSPRGGVLVAGIALAVGTAAALAAAMVVPVRGASLRTADPRPGARPARGAAPETLSRARPRRRSRADR